MSDDGRVHGHVIGHALVLRAGMRSLVGRHAYVVADNLGQDLVILHLGKFELLKPEVILSVYAYCFGFHMFAFLNYSIYESITWPPVTGIACPVSPVCSIA